MCVEAVAPAAGAEEGRGVLVPGVRLAGLSEELDVPRRIAERRTSSSSSWEVKGQERERYGFTDNLLI